MVSKELQGLVAKVRALELRVTALEYVLEVNALPDMIPKARRMLLDQQIQIAERVFSEVSRDRARVAS